MINGSLSPVDWTGWGTPFLFFTGKGGVGKTTVASAASLALEAAAEAYKERVVGPYRRTADIRPGSGHFL